MHVRSGSPVDSEALFDACRFNGSYDGSSHEDLSLYIFDLLLATGHPEPYVSRLENLLADPAAEADWDQVTRVLLRFVRAGEVRLLPGLYRRLAQTLQTSDAGAAALIAFAGGATYRFAAARRFALSQNLSEIDFNLLQEFIEAVGEQETRSFCDSLAAIDPELHAYVLRVWEATRVPAAPKRPVDRPLDYAGFRDWLDSAATVQPPGLRRSQRNRRRNCLPVSLRT